MGASSAMTDREQIVAMLERAGVIFTIDEEPNEIETHYRKTLAYASSLTVAQGDGERNLGYSYFVTTFFFDRAGALVCMGAWE